VKAVEWPGLQLVHYTLLGRMLTDLLTSASASRRDRAVRAGIGKQRTSCSDPLQGTCSYAA
jgi:hypothetical protein